MKQSDCISLWKRQKQAYATESANSKQQDNNENRTWASSPSQPEAMGRFICPLTVSALVETGETRSVGRSVDEGDSSRGPSIMKASVCDWAW